MSDFKYMVLCSGDEHIIWGFYDSESDALNAVNGAMKEDDCECVRICEIKHEWSIDTKPRYVKVV